MILKFIIGLMILAPAHATKYLPLDLSTEVGRSSVIFVGEILEAKCLNTEGREVPPGQGCTHPGSSKKYFQKVKMIRRLADESEVKPTTDPEIISFAFTSKAHRRVPEDSYASEIGQKRIFFLQRSVKG